MQDLVSVKSLEGYTVVECDEIEGSNNVSYLGDDFTVETALEDLEFGFTVIKSTQKVINIYIIPFLNSSFAYYYAGSLCT